MPTIPQEDARIMREGSARFPTKGAQCNASCAFYFACQNSRDFEECQGFLMLNGDSEKLLKRGLKEHELEYIANAHSFIQRSIDNGHTEQADVILRDIGQLRERAFPEPTQRESGFGYMLECARGVQNNPTQEPDPVERSQPSQGFIGMVESAFSHEPTDRTLTRAVDPNLFPDICDGKSCPAEYQRNCSANRAEHYGQRCVYKILTNEEMKHPEPQQRIAKRATLPELLDRLEIVEKELRNAENSPKNEHIFPNRPNLCKTKNPNGLDET